MQVLVNKFELVRDGVTYKAGSVVDLPDEVAAELVESAPKEFAYAMPVPLPEEPAEPAEPEKLDGDAGVTLEEMTVAQLQQLAAEKGITLAKSAKKADIIAAINADEAEGLPDVDAAELVK